MHAWINTCAVSNGKISPFHIASLHPDWLSTDEKNSPDDNEAFKIDPGHPDAADWTFRVYLDVARHYAVDGIHFDFVRYGGRNFGYNPVSLARFFERCGARAQIRRLPGSDLPAPDDTTWQQWRRDQVTSLVRKIYVHTAQISPGLVVSAAVICWGNGPRDTLDWQRHSAAMNRVYQDWQGWLKEGILDLACPMTYFQAGRHTDYQRNWSEFIKNRQYGRAATVGVGCWFNTPAQTLSLLQIARSPSKAGHWPYGVMLYSYAGTNAAETLNAAGKRTELQFQEAFYSALGAPSRHAEIPPFPTSVPPPPMPWKTAPKQAHLKGYVLTPALDPIDGAAVTLWQGGRRYRGVTDGTGFYAFANVPPGEYRVRVAASGYKPQESRTVLTPGRVGTASFTVGGAAVLRTPSIRALLGADGRSRRLPDGTPTRLERLRVILGTDTLPGAFYAIDSSGVGIRFHLAAPPLIPFQPGDVVSAVGTLRTLEGEPVIDRATARLTDILKIPTVTSPQSVAVRDPGFDAPRCGTLARVQATVLEVTPEAVLLDAGVRLQILRKGRKDPGVESVALTLPELVPGSRVAVTGVTAVGDVGPNRAVTIRLYPRGPEDIAVLAPQASSWQRPAAHGVALALFRRPGSRDRPAP